MIKKRLVLVVILLIAISGKAQVDIGTTNPQALLDVLASNTSNPTATVPASPTQGTMYYDSVANKLKVYDGSVWQECW